MKSVRVSAKGQLTIPKDMFDALGRDQDLVLIQEGHRLVLMPAAEAARKAVDDLEGWESLSQKAFAAVWENPEDAEAWEDL